LFGDGKKRRVVIKGTRKEKYSFQTRRLVSMGECESVKEVEESIQSVCQTAGIAYDLLMIRRVDFKFDLADRSQIKSWMKSCNLLIAAITVMWKCKLKNLYCGRAGQYGEEKNNKAKHGNLEIEAYNKDIQKPSARIPRRLELRCLDLEGKSILKGLLDWRCTLRKAKEYYSQATILLNERLAKMFQEAQETAGGILAVNDFIHCHIDGIFSREQLRGLYAKLGTRNPDAAAKHWYKLRKQYHLDEYSRHDFRATCATVWKEEGMDIQMIQVMLGHEDMATTTKYYTKVRDDSYQKAKEIMDASGNGCDISCDNTNWLHALINNVLNTIP
jgi:hypothetical protein